MLGTVTDGGQEESVKSCENAAHSEFPTWGFDLGATRANAATLERHSHSNLLIVSKLHQFITLFPCNLVEGV